MKPLVIIVSTAISLFFIGLGAVCLHWGFTVKDTASDVSVSVGAFFLYSGARLIYSVWKNK